jgi:diaminopimelate epimerase
MDNVHYTKMHGIGNEFIIINEPDRFTSQELSALSKKINDKDSGIGSDGLINIVVSDNENTDLVMNMYNPDGSEAEMCGNGIRCITLLAIDQELVDKTQDIKIQTGAGILVTSQINDSNNIVVNMGKPSFDLENNIKISELSHYQAGDAIDISVGKTQISDARAVSMGNPHLVSFINDVDSWPLEIIGPLVENHILFPNRINFEIAEIQNTHNIKLRVWERGAGITKACGTGACATFYAALSLQKTDTKDVNVHLPGGTLKLSYYDDNIYMEGPAEYLLEGDWQDN